MLLTMQVNGTEICYDESGYDNGPAIVLLTGLLPYLAKSHWVIRVCWRGHGPSRDDIPDFGVDEQVRDTLALLDLLGVDEFYIVSHSHGGWAALEIVNRVGKPRIRGVVMIDQIMTAPPPEFAADLQKMQPKATWRTARKSLFDNWIGHSTNQAVLDHFMYSMGSFGHSMWSLSCRVIADAYKTWTSPMARMAAFADPPPIRHIFSHPLDNPQYRQAHQDFAKEHAWFSYTDLKGVTHFPSLEIPARVAEQVEDVIKRGA
ncbi:putative 1H-3-hydroxy-4-oxoquinaldine 2,4-dioxygenase [Thozetella sp. PMI_491]|nr:putative 1H-3-hydroxy-4-oxoquinaldine 2,4-dioxygenase [Thozetella sp. PMI_491]